MMALSTNAAKAQRKQAMAMGPKAGAATRMSGNEPPQTADKRTSWVNWRPFMAWSLSAGAGLGLGLFGGRAPRVLGVSKATVWRVAVTVTFLRH
jgi:ribosome modulation factor